MTKSDYESKLEEILEKTTHIEVAKEKIEVAISMAKEAGINMTLTQRLGISSHLCAMVNRHFEGGDIPDVDPEMFKEVSETSIDLAARVCELLPNLVEGEKYLLSIHFEAARLSEN